MDARTTSGPPTPAPPALGSRRAGSSALTPSVSARLGPYRLLQVIGGGGTGVVHLGLDPTGRAVAVKVLRPHVAADPSARDRLAREVDVLRRVRSPRVAEVLDADPDAEQPYVVTEFVPAPPLDAWVAENGPLRPPALARFALGLGDALAAIHAVGVVHRDLKPANVLVQDGEAVVIDFGIAQVADDERLTSTGLVMGTPGWLSPEVLDGGALTSSTDWWGWAAVVVYAATGRAPFGHGPTEAVLSRVRRGAADLAGVPAEVAGVLHAALAPDPAVRPRPRQLREAVQSLADPGAWGSGASGAAAIGAVTGSAAPTVGLGAGLGAATAVLGGATLPWSLGATAAAPPVASGPSAQAPPAGPSEAATTALAPRAPDVDPRPGSGPAGAPSPAPLPGTLAGASAADDAADVAAAGQASLADHPGARRGVLAVLLAALVAAAAVVPGAVVVVVAAGAVLARAVDRTAHAAGRRRDEHGPRRSDTALTVLGVPGHLLSAALVTVPALLLPAAMAVSAAFVVGWALSPSGSPAPAQPLALAAGALSGVLTCWWGPGGAALRGGARLVVGGASRRPRVALVLAGVLALVAVAAVAVSWAGTAPDWSPLPLGGR